MYRSTLELLLDGRDGLEVVGSVTAGDEAAAAAAQLDPAVVLMDFRLPGLDGAGATAAVLAAAPTAAVLCLTAEATEADRRGGPRRRARSGWSRRAVRSRSSSRQSMSATERGEHDP